VVKKCYDYLPFGEEIPAGTLGRGSCYPAAPGADGVKFTGKKRDGETGLDFFGARYMSSAQGRWTGPDKPFADQHPADPQTWNLYAYVRNNPLRLVDDTGEGSREARTEAVNAALAANGGFREALFASNNSSPGDFEDALLSGALSNTSSPEYQKFKGLMGEANYLESAQKHAAVNNVTIQTVPGLTEEAQR
jgi:RHS repeat-associated protein